MTVGKVYVDFRGNLAVGVDGLTGWPSRVMRYDPADLKNQLAALPAPYPQPLETRLRIVGLPVGAISHRQRATAPQHRSGKDRAAACSGRFALARRKSETRFLIFLSQLECNGPKQRQHCHLSFETVVWRIQQTSARKQADPVGAAQEHDSDGLLAKTSSACTTITGVSLPVCWSREIAQRGSFKVDRLTTAGCGQNTARPAFRSSSVLQPFRSSTEVSCQCARSMGLRTAD